MVWTYMALRLAWIWVRGVEGPIFGVKGIGGSDGIVYAKVVSCVGVKDYSCWGGVYFL